MRTSSATAPSGRPLAAASTLALLLVGCVAPTEFYRPRENVEATSPDGAPAASYSFEVACRAAGAVRVWSSGTRNLEIEGRDRAVLGVSLEVENNATLPLRLHVDRLRIDRAVGPGRADEGAVIEDPRQQIVPAGETATLALDYVLPPTFDGDDLRAFRVDWRLEGGGGEPLRESTPFQPQPDLYVRTYDPFFDPYWGYPGWYGTGYHARWGYGVGYRWGVRNYRHW